MAKPAPKAIKTFATLAAIIGWLAVIAQLYLIILNRTTSIGETIIRFFSYFTIQTNILVATCFTMLASNKQNNIIRFFRRPSVLAAITVYITIVGLVYQLILRSTWHPRGLQMIVDELLHSAIPLYTIIIWVVFLPKYGLNWNLLFSWVIYPACYLLFVLLRGTFSKFYPYPFLHVPHVGFRRVMLNSALVLIVFLLVSLLFISLSRRIDKNQRKLFPI